VTTLPLRRGRPCSIPLPGQPDPGQPFRTDDADHVGVVAEAGDLALLDGQEPELTRLAHRVLHGRAAYAGYRGHVLDRQTAVLPSGDFSRHEAKHRLLGQREPGREPRWKPSRGGQRRRRSIEASVRGREPTAVLEARTNVRGSAVPSPPSVPLGFGLCPGWGLPSDKVRPSMRTDNDSASRSVIWPSP
jgi:hypothetical protein